MKKEYSDSELLMMMNEHSEYAKDLLYNKYQYIVRIYVKKYKKMA